MADATYFCPEGGLPDQAALMTDRSVFTDAYVFIPRGVMRDIVTSELPFWTNTRAWILARPLSGFAETFAQYIMEVAPGGGSSQPEPDQGAEGAFFVTDGVLTLDVAGNKHALAAGGFAYIPPGVAYSVSNTSGAVARFHWIRKAYEAVTGLDLPDVIITSDQETPRNSMPDTDGRWATSRFIDPADLRYDMHVNIVSFAPGAVIPFAETHVMEHGLYMLQGKGVYRLNQDWVEVEAGDYIWLRAFCPQACYAGGPEPFRYLLYKDVNRHPKLPR